MIPRRVPGLVSCALLASALAGCSGAGLSDNVKDTVANVVTLQRGTISELKDLRGTGPFQTYDLAPSELLLVVRDAAAFARGAGDVPVSAIFVSERRGEVVAKERAGEDALSDAYGPDFRTAMVATVHAVRGEPGKSRLEIHAMRRGPFHAGVVAWERDMPVWIDQARRARSEPEPRIKPIR